MQGSEVGVILHSQDTIAADYYPQHSSSASNTMLTADTMSHIFTNTKYIYHYQFITILLMQWLYGTIKINTLVNHMPYGLYHAYYHYSTVLTVL